MRSSAVSQLFLDGVRRIVQKKQNIYIIHMFLDSITIYSLNVRTVHPSTALIHVYQRTNILLGALMILSSKFFTKQLIILFSNNAYKLALDARL